MSTPGVHVAGHYDTNVYRILSTEGGGESSFLLHPIAESLYEYTVARIQEAAWILRWLMDKWAENFSFWDDFGY